MRIDDITIKSAISSLFNFWLLPNTRWSHSTKGQPDIQHRQLISIDDRAAERLETVTSSEHEIMLHI
jgi:hypothetical protein